MESCHIRGCIHTCVLNNILLYLISIFILQSIRPGPNIVFNDQLNRARVSVFSRSMSAISISQCKCKHLSNMNHVLRSLAVKLPTIILPVQYNWCDKKACQLFLFLFCCFTSQVNSYGHCGTVSSPNHTFSWAGLNKWLTSNSCTYFRL